MAVMMAVKGSWISAWGPADLYSRVLTRSTSPLTLPPPPQPSPSSPHPPNQQPLRWIWHSTTYASQTHPTITLKANEVLQVIASRPKRTATRPARGGRRGSARAEVLGKAPASPSARARAAAAAPAPNATPVAQSAQKIIVSNLPQDVNEAQIKVRPVPNM